LLSVTEITRKIFARLPKPRTRLSRFTLYWAATEGALLLLERVLRLAGGTDAASTLHAWTSPGLLGTVLAILVLIVAMRWFRNHVMWSVRNRLIVTYLFIGGVPITLVLAMAFISGYAVMEQMATFFALSEMRAQEQRLGAANAAATERIEDGASARQIMESDTVFRGRSISVTPQESSPKWLQDGFTGLVIDQGQYYVRAANTVAIAGKTMMVVSSVPFDQKFLAKISVGLGTLTFAPQEVRVRRKDQPDVQETKSYPAISAGALDAPRGNLDREIPFGGLIQARDWETGRQDLKFLAGSTRLSMFFSYFANTSSVEWTGLVGVFLAVAAVAFAIVVLIALVIGIRLTRTITYSVANLYKATEHVNRGDFTHRIQVREKDQLAALQIAFNSMTESLEKLIVEQKEKERLQSELEIAHEVQSQLFPREVSGTPSLELYGICRPARIVSGDYYDFLTYGPEQIGIAVGDISGKGISAALLMATIHSAVRAYEQEQLVPVTAASVFGRETRTTRLAMPAASPSPSQVLWLLNRHLFQSTQPEKYATMFLGFYDDEKRTLTYSNAGHLPPIILGRDGEIRRLEAGGMVVGLFDNMEYEEEKVEFRPGDLFIAFSDGMTEPENEFGEFGEKRLVESIAAYRDLPLERITEHAVAAVQDWIGSTEQPDDITLVLARCMD
jgi:sigma-B regulation protein RsbU (phosphoserine phosphatase)